MSHVGSMRSSSVRHLRSKSRAQTCRRVRKCWSCRSGTIDAACLTQHFPRPHGISMHLLDQRFGAVELFLAADKIDKGDFRHLAIEIAVKIEEMDFEQRRTVVECR